MPQRRPTLTDVAAEAGVSKAAVSRVVNDAAGVSPQTREHVRQVISRLGYRPDPVARALASGHGDVVELVVVDDAGAPTLLARIAETVSLGVLLVNVPPALAKQFHDRCERVVSMGPSAPGVPFVSLENAEGTAAAIRHLHETGRRRIGALHGQDDNPDAAARREGHRHAIRDLDLPDISATGKFRRESGYELTLKLLADEPELDAVFVACDLMATGALQALADAGRRVPQDVAVVGFDDSVIAECANPPMSSVHQPVEQMAAAATRALVKRQLAPYWQCVFPAPLKVRQSSAQRETAG
jgi:DNA-binding LacI/PurR family transcriptional regulator